MRAQLSNHDYEQLSAYIDGQLAPAERRKLEERLHVQAELQAAFDEISRTRALLRSAPRRRAPRNFTLTPTMVGERASQKRGSWWNLFPVLSFTSALATLALVATIMFQLLPGQMAAQTAAKQPQSQADRVAEIVRQTMTVVEATDQASQNFAAPQAQTAKPGSERSAAPAQPAAPTQSTESQPALGAAMPTATAQIAAAAPAAQGTATAELPAANTAADNAQNTPPIITWNGNTNPQGAYGMGGGGGQGPSLGPLLGPPEAAAPNTVMGKGGGGGDITSGQSGTIVLPAQGLNAPDTATAEASSGQAQPAAGATSEPAATPVPAVVAPAPVNPDINGTGPILGVPSQGEGGQIVEKKAILGQPQAGAANNSVPAQPQPGTDQHQVTGNSPSGGQTVLGLPLIAVAQGLLVLIAVGTGLAAFLVRRRAR